jgi:hypothetical protein
VISSCPSFSVFLNCLLVLSQIILSELEFLGSIFHLWDVLLGGGLESLLWLERLLEIHPVLGGVIEWLL